MRQIVNGIDCRYCGPLRREVWQKAHIGRHESRLPIVAVHHLGEPLQSTGQGQHGAAEKGKALGVVWIIAARVTVEPWPCEVIVLFDAVHWHPSGARILPV